MATEFKLKKFFVWETLHDKIKEVADDTRPYKVYTAIINQTGTTAPTVVAELENTLGANVTYSYDAVGSYFVNCPNKFTAGKTFVIFSPNNLTEQHRFIIQSTSQIQLLTGNGAIYANDIIVDGTLEIRVYK